MRQSVNLMGEKNCEVERPSERSERGRGARTVHPIARDIARRIVAGRDDDPGWRSCFRVEGNGWVDRHRQEGRKGRKMVGRVEGEISAHVQIPSSLFNPLYSLPAHRHRRQKLENHHSPPPHPPSSHPGATSPNKSFVLQGRPSSLFRVLWVARLRVGLGGGGRHARARGEVIEIL